MCCPLLCVVAISNRLRTLRSPITAVESIIKNWLSNILRESWRRQWQQCIDSAGEVCLTVCLTTGAAECKEKCGKVHGEHGAILLWAQRACARYKYLTSNWFDYTWTAQRQPPVAFSNVTQRKTHVICLSIFTRLPPRQLASRWRWS